MKKLVIECLLLFGIWAIGYYVALYFMDGTTYKVAYATLCAWWAVAYYSRPLNITLAVVKLWVPVYCLIFILHSFWNGEMYKHDVFEVLFVPLLKSIVIASPVIFNSMNELVFNRLKISITKQTGANQNNTEKRAR